MQWTQNYVAMTANIQCALSDGSDAYLQVVGMFTLTNHRVRIHHVDGRGFMCLVYGLGDGESYAFNAGGIYANTGFNLVGKMNFLLRNVVVIIYLPLPQLQPKITATQPRKLHGPKSARTTISFEGQYLNLVDSVRLDKVTRDGENGASSSCLIHSVTR